MGKSEFEYDVAVVGIGRVGLPLALAMRSAGLSVLGIDKDQSVLRQVTAGEMPFDEPGCGQILRDFGLPVTSDMSRAATADHVVITVGTPLRQHIESDLTALNGVINALSPHLRPGQAIALRSTVAPGTTLYMRAQLERRTGLRVGADLNFGFCPERLAEGKALEELKELPQIVGTWDQTSDQKLTRLFQRISPEILHTTPEAAELAKLFNNTYRYVQFALANQFAMIAEHFGTDVFEVLHLSNWRYPRGGISTPGLTAGTCLRKDFGMLAEHVPGLDLLTAAWKVNEYLPRYLVETAERTKSLNGSKVAVLGYTFKRDTDDSRDSLVPKLIRYLQRALVEELRVHDPNLPLDHDCSGCPNQNMEKAVEGVDVIFLAINHSAFELNYPRLIEALPPEATVIDVWNIGRRSGLSYSAGDVQVQVSERMA